MLDPKDEIKQKIDIVELIGEYLPLKPAGTQGFKAVCPFHSEKSPSFHVNGERQIWHCFGCGEGGDCFSFVQKMEGMDFAEVLQHLGQKVGVEVKRFSSAQSNARQRLLALNQLAAQYFQKVLEQSTGAATARAYVESRGIPPHLIERFGLGYALPEWSALADFLKKRGYADSELVAAGLAQKKQSGTGLIDRFRDRLMIPLRDQHGNTLGFTGRILPSSPQQTSAPKYMNSPETAVYHKGDVVFGLDLAKRAIKEAKSVIIVEGNLDVVASHKAGVEQVVASSGTALTESQLKLITRYTSTLVFAFDQDAAGFTAAKRGISLGRSLGCDVRALLLPENVKDPDELVQKSPAAWKKITESSVPIMQFFIEQVIKGKNLADVDDKRSVAQELIPALHEIPDVVEQEHWISAVAELLRVDPDRLRPTITRPSVQPTQANPTSTPTIKTPVVPSKATRRSKGEQAFQLILGLFVSEPSKYVGQLSVLPNLAEQETPLSALYIKAKIYYDSARNAPDKSFYARFQKELEREPLNDLSRLLEETFFLAQTTFSALSASEVQQQMKSLVDLLVREQAQLRRKEIARLLRDAERRGDEEVIQSLLKELNQSN